MTTTVRHFRDVDSPELWAIYYAAGGAICRLLNKDRVTAEATTEVRLPV